MSNQPRSQKDDNETVARNIPEQIHRGLLEVMKAFESLSPKIITAVAMALGKLDREPTPELDLGIMEENEFRFRAGITEFPGGAYKIIDIGIMKPVILELPGETEKGSCRKIILQLAYKLDENENGGSPLARVPNRVRMLLYPSADKPCITCNLSPAGDSARDESFAALSERFISIMLEKIKLGQLFDLQLASAEAAGTDAAIKKVLN